MKKFNIKNFGILPDTNTLLTKEIQKIINELPNDSVLLFPKGKYLLSTIFLKSNLTIKLEDGCEILGSKNFYDYAPQEKIDFPLYQDASHSYFDCSLFVGKNLKNLSIIGKGTIDMQSCWDEDNVRNIVHRGPKCIALKECDNVLIQGIQILNATDLAVYFAGCNNVICDHLNLKVYIDGISPDNSKNVEIKNCKVVSGDDGIVFKSSFNLNKFDICDNIKVSDCKIRSRCNAIKLGTESNGGFKNFLFENIDIKNTRITGISIESVDGAHIDNIVFNNIYMKNTGSPIFVHIGDRLRAPQGTEIGSIKNIQFNNITAVGPYKVFDAIPHNYIAYKNNDTHQFPGFFSKGKKKKKGKWQITSNVCGLKDHYIENISFKNIFFELNGGVKIFNKKVPLKAQKYPEVNAYGKVLPAYGMYFRFIKNLQIKDFEIKLRHKDKRPKFVLEEII